MNCDLTAEALRERLSYDERTGLFTWIVPTRLSGKLAGSAGHDGYTLIGLKLDGKNRHFKAHRLAWLYVHGEWPMGVVDHANRDRSDNRIRNLRDVSVLMNAQNRSKRGQIKSHKVSEIFRFAFPMGHVVEKT